MIVAKFVSAMEENVDEYEERIDHELFLTVVCPGFVGYKSTDIYVDVITPLTESLNGQSYDILMVRRPTDLGQLLTGPRSDPTILDHAMQIRDPSTFEYRQPYMYDYRTTQFPIEVDQECTSEHAVSVAYLTISNSSLSFFERLGPLATHIKVSFCLQAAAGMSSPVSYSTSVPRGSMVMLHLSENRGRPDFINNKVRIRSSDINGRLYLNRCPRNETEIRNNALNHDTTFYIAPYELDILGRSLSLCYFPGVRIGYPIQMHTVESLFITYAFLGKETQSSKEIQSYWGRITVDITNPLVSKDQTLQLVQDTEKISLPLLGADGPYAEPRPIKYRILSLPSSGILLNTETLRRIKVDDTVLSSSVEYYPAPGYFNLLPGINTTITNRTIEFQYNIFADYLNSRGVTKTEVSSPGTVSVGIFPARSDVVQVQAQAQVILRGRGSYVTVEGYSVTMDTINDMYPIMLEVSLDGNSGFYFRFNTSELLSLPAGIVSNEPMNNQPLSKILSFGPSEQEIGMTDSCESQGCNSRIWIQGPVTAINKLLSTFQLSSVNQDVTESVLTLTVHGEEYMVQNTTLLHLDGIDKVGSLTGATNNPLPVSAKIAISCLSLLLVVKIAMKARGWKERRQKESSQEMSVKVEI